MKKFSLILSLLSFVFTSRGQQYYPMFGYHHTWYVGYRAATSSPRSQIDDLVYTIMDATGDTIINNKQYFKAKLYWDNYLYSYDTTLYFREDTTLQEVWILQNDSGKEKLIYNYSLNKGDSIYLDFDFQDSSTTYYYTRTGWYHVDSTATVNILTGQRKALFLSNPNNGYDPLLFTSYPEQEWIEGIGSTIMPDYTQHDINNAGAQYWGYLSNFYYMLICSFDNNTKNYHAYWIYRSSYTYTDSDSCELSIDNTSGIAGINKPDLDMNLFPNPCDDLLQINAYLPQTSYAKVEIFNVTGIKIFDRQIMYPNTTFQSAIDVSRFPSGMYFVRLSTSDAFEMSKFVKY